MICEITASTGKLFTTFGISPYRAIQAATRDAALVISPRPNFGVLAPGKAADVIAVDGDPLESLDQLRQAGVDRLRMLAGVELFNHALRDELVAHAHIHGHAVAADAIGVERVEGKNSVRATNASVPVTS